MAIKKLISLSLLTLISFGAAAQTYMMREHIDGVSPSIGNGDGASTNTGSSSSGTSNSPALSSSSSSSSSSSTPIVNGDYSMTTSGFLAGQNRLSINANYVQSEQTIYFVAVGNVPVQITLIFSNGQVHQFNGPTRKTFSMPLESPHQNHLSLFGKIGPSNISFPTSDGVSGATTIYF